jgi:amino acid transporter
VIATLATPLVIVVYMLLCVGCMWHYWTKRRSEFNPFLHLILPIGGIVLFFFPLYYQYYKTPPPYPFKYANWIALGWAGLGIAVAAYVVLFARERVADIDRVYVEDETISPEDAVAQFPTA